MAFDDRRGRAALVADIRRELQVLDHQLDGESPATFKLRPDESAEQVATVSTVVNAGGLIWRLAMLNAYDAIANED